jgi:TRAP-type C4-dicarboxylate transport system permease small subunit
MYTKSIVLLDRIAAGAAWAGMAMAVLALAATSVIMLVEIGMRWFLQSSTDIMDVVVSNSMAVMTFGALGYALNQGGLIRVVLMAKALPPKARWLLEIAVNATGAGLAGFLTYYVWVDFYRSVVRGTTTSGVVPVPLWVPSFIILAGSAILCLTLVANTLALMIDQSRVPVLNEEA